VESAVQPCAVPVALIIFNRPDLTARVFEAIRRAQPRQLFIIADGPRNEAERKLCHEAREAAAKVDWKCDLRTDFSKENLGCGRRPASGIDWVFSQVEEAIILEDDCIPTHSFFHFCEQLLNHYRGDSRVMHISGNNYLPQSPRTPSSYYLSKYTFSCGWATWRRAWRHYDYSLKTWPQFKTDGSLAQICPDPIEAKYWANKLDTIYQRKRDDAWDYQWNYAVWAQGGLSILPRMNLISNEGFREDATHTRAIDQRANLPIGDIWEISHPQSMQRDEHLDRLMFDRVLGGARLRQRQTWKYRLSKPLRLYRKWRRQE
jgi:hypothetical protein